MITTVVLDWNGTVLADSLENYRSACDVIKIAGGQKPSFEVFSATFGFPAEDFHKQLGCKDGFNGKFLEFYEPRALKCRTRKGARDLLVFLKERGIVCLILSNHTLCGIKTQLKRLGLERMFAEVLTRESQGQNKAERLGYFLAKRRILGQNVLVVGDSPEDVEAGKILGAKTAAITGGCYSTDRLKASEPDFLVHNLHVVKEMIMRLNRSLTVKGNGSAYCHAREGYCHRR